MALHSHRLLVATARWLIAGAAVLAVVGAWAACGRTAPGLPAPADPALDAGPRPAASAPLSAAPSSSAAVTPGAPTPGAGATPCTTTPGTTTSGAAATRGTTTPAESAGTRNLEAARTVEQLLQLVDRGRPGAARRLLSGTQVWPRRELAAIQHIDLISARVWGDSRAGAVTLAATVRLAVRRDSPLPSGRTTLFFTLGRDGSAGDWLVTAVATSP